MNSSSESALVTQCTSRALTRSLQPVLLFILVIFLAIEYYGPFCSSKPELEQRHSG